MSRKPRVPFPCAALKAKTPKRQPKPVKAISQSQEGTPAESLVSTLLDLGFAEGRRVLLCRTLAEMRLIELEKTRPHAEALAAFLDSARKAVGELLREGDTQEASRLVSELAKVSRPDGVLLSGDPDALRVLDELCASIPPPQGETTGSSPA